MNRFRPSLAHLTALAILLWLSPSCAREQILFSIQVQPALETFGSTNTPVSADAGLQVQLRALGSYAHPPVTKDITDQVAWDSNTPGIATVTSTGLLTATGQDCGNALVSATVVTNTNGNRSSSGAVVTGYMTATVVCFTGSITTGPALTVDFAGAGAGTVTSSPPGLGCASTCTGNFPSGTQVTLTATPNGSTFGGWVGCDAVAGQTCTVDLSSARTVTVTFN